MASESSKKPDTGKLARLLRDYIKTDGGHTSLERLAKSGVTINQETPFPNARIFGAYCWPNILLNPNASPATLLSGLRHEIRHVEQEQDGLAGQEKGELTGPIRNPRAFVELQLLREADAYAHQVDFAYEHALKTGDRAPARLLKKEMSGIFGAYAAAREEPGGSRAKALRRAFSAYMQDEDHKRFDALVALTELDQILKAQQTMARRSRDISNILKNAPVNKSPDARTIKAFGRTQTAAGSVMNYFNGLSAKQLSGAEFSGILPASIEKRMQKMEDRYARFFTGLKSDKGPQT